MPTVDAPPHAARRRLPAAWSAFFVGWLGVHKFLSGRPGTGAVMLGISLGSLGLLAPVMFVASVIEGVMYLNNTDAEFVETYWVGKRRWF